MSSPSIVLVDGDEAIPRHRPSGVEGAEVAELLPDTFKINDTIRRVALALMIAWRFWHDRVRTEYLGW